MPLPSPRSPAGSLRARAVPREPAAARRRAGSAACALAALTAATATAQSPPPTGAVAVVGTVNQMQAGGTVGEQRIGAICSPPFFRPNSVVGVGGVAVGGSIAWWSEAIHPVLQPPTHHSAGTCITLFFVSPFSFSSVPLPLTAPNFNLLFVPPATAILVGAPWTQVHQTGGGGAIVPPGGFNRWFMTLDVPQLPALVGSVWTAQSMRLDPANLLLYLSNDYLVQIWS
jgi:hypothetical protein